MIYISIIRWHNISLKSLTVGPHLNIRGKYIRDVYSPSSTPLGRWFSSSQHLYSGNKMVCIT